MVHSISIPASPSLSSISPFFAPLKEKVLTFAVENKYLEMISNFMLWKIASNIDFKLVENKRKVRLAFVIYLTIYTLYLIYSSISVLDQNDMRSVKLTNPILDFGKRAIGGQSDGQGGTRTGGVNGGAASSFTSLLTNGLMGQKINEHMQMESTVRDYDLSVISSSFNKMLFYSMAMYVAHVYFNRFSSWIYHAALMAPLTTIREPIFQLHVLKMHERGPRLRPFKPAASSNLFETVTKVMGKTKESQENNTQQGEKEKDTIEEKNDKGESESEGEEQEEGEGKNNHQEPTVTQPIEK